MNLSASDIDVTARTVYGESRGEPRLGRIAVAHVVRNRALFKDTSPAEECHKPWQFSCWDMGDPNLAVIEAVSMEDPVFQECTYCALAVLLGQEPDPTGGATHYFASHIPVPDWASPPAVKTCAIGHHLFYANVAF